MVRHFGLALALASCALFYGCSPPSSEAEAAESKKVAAKPTAVPAELRAISDPKQLREIALSDKAPCEIRYVVGAHWLSAVSLLDRSMDVPKLLRDFEASLRGPGSSGSGGNDSKDNKSASNPASLCGLMIDGFQRTTRLHIAEMLIKAGQKDRASALVEEVKKSSSPDYFDSPTLAELLYLLNRKGDALALFSNTEDKSKDLSLKREIAKRLARPAFEAGDTETIKVISEHLGSAREVVLALAEAAARAGRWDDVVQLLQSAGYKQIGLAFANALRKTGKGDAARDFATKVESSQFWGNDGRYGVMVFWVREGDLEKARAVAKLWQGTDSGAYLRALVQLAALETQRGNTTEAEKHLLLAKAIAGKTTDLGARAGFVGELGKTGPDKEFDVALQLAKDQIAKESLPRLSYLLLAKELTYAGKADTAASTLQSAVAITDEVRRCHDLSYASYLYALLGRYKEAIESTSTCTDDLNRIWQLYGRGMILRARAQQSIPDFAASYETWDDWRFLSLRPKFNAHHFQ